MEMQIGSTVGDYQVVGILGAGGMGKVYKVRSMISDRIEAMKVLLPDLAHAPELADRFLREIKVQASLEHPNIAALHTALRVENQLIMLMEFVEGMTLEQRLKGGPVPVAQAVDYIAQVLAALDYAHAHGVIHRDIKPANMILTPAGVVKLMDFGIAKAAADRRLTMTGTTMGSLYYMAPEQIKGAAALDARADLYAVGVSLYELVTGKRPFDGDSQFAIMAAHLEKTPVPPVELDPKLPQALNDAILMAVSKEPDARFQTAAAFRNALGNVMAPREAPVAVAREIPAAAPAAPTLTLPPSRPPIEAVPAIEPAPAEPRRGHRGLWMALGAVAMAAVVIAVIQFAPWKGSKAAPAQHITDTPAPAEPAATPAAVPAASPSTAAGASAPPLIQPAPATKAEESARKREPRTSPAPAKHAAEEQEPVPVPRPSEPPPGRVVADPGPGPSAIKPASELQILREKLAKLNARAGAIRSGLQTLQQQQAAQGIGLRGDIQEAANLMNTYLEGANDAQNAGDAASTTTFLDRAERQIERLEKFLNH